MKLIIILGLVTMAALSVAQAKLPLFTPVLKPVSEAETVKPQRAPDGVWARVKDVARFRGVRSNQLVGTGLLLGLEGPGESKKIGPTVSALVYYLRRQNIEVYPKTIEPKNAALVMVTADLPPFAVNGQRVDVTITSIGDARSIRNGTLVITELKSPADPNTVYAVATGPVSIGGFGVSQNGNSQVKGFQTVGRIPGGAMIEKGAPTNVVYEGNKMYIELDDPDMSTAQRAEEQINKTLSGFNAKAVNGGTIEVTLPAGMSSTLAMARLEEIQIPVDTPALIVVNEKTGTIIMGGNVKIAPVAFMYGSLSIKVEETTMVSQPPPFSGGKTEKVPQTAVSAKEDPAKVGVTMQNTTVADLAAIFQKLSLTPGDVIAILQGLKQQGALKARVVLQ